mmetsp:Transcript_17279/g.29008  ORF Transcript_17279/g.29008 Transcript_17279/m.29008 type:complete len:323 (+) Transcript_17279:12-980(+)
MLLPTFIFGLAFLSFAAYLHAVSIEDFGAIEDIDQWKVALHNSDALQKAILSANSSADDRTVLIPAGKTYVMANSTLMNLHDVTIQVEGMVRFSDYIDGYPLDENDDRIVDAMWWFYDCTGIHITGKGTLDGQGLKWWRLCYTGIDNRPKLIQYSEVRDITLEYVTLLNSPNWFVNLKDCADAVIHDITIFTDSSITRIGDRDSVMYPLNTDGIDISATNVTVYNCNITNYDDAIVPKPCRSTWRYCQCSGNIEAYNNYIKYSVGLTIGSVPPHQDVNCVRNVTFRDTYMYRPLKAIYIKSNPGDEGTGIVEDILYENIFIE